MSLAEAHYNPHSEGLYTLAMDCVAGRGRGIPQGIGLT